VRLAAEEAICSLYAELETLVEDSQVLDTHTHTHTHTGKDIHGVRNEAAGRAKRIHGHLPRVTGQVGGVLN
jgi:hypothetical protein